MNLGAKLAVYGRLMRVDKPIGTYLVIWPMLWALWVAGAGHPDAFVVFVFLTGAFLMRSAGCVINDFADRNIDLYVQRTQGRPLATGEASPAEAIALFAVLVLAAFLLVLLMNTLTIQLAFAAVGLAVIYPFMKRFTHLPQVFLGVAFAWGIPMAFAAVTGSVPTIAWLMVLANICWVVAYDTMYAMVDRDDDLEIGVKSTAILFAQYDRFIIAVPASHHSPQGTPALFPRVPEQPLCWGPGVRRPVSRLRPPRVAQPEKSGIIPVNLMVRSPAYGQRQPACPHR